MTGQLNVVLKSPTLPMLLRSATPPDGPALVEILNNPSNTEFDPHAGSGDLSLSTAESIITRWLEAYASPTPSRVNLLVVDLSKDSKVVGLSGYGHIATNPDGTRVGDVGVMINPEARGKGFGVEAMRLSIEYAFGKIKEGGLALDGVTATMLKRNAPMVGVMRKLGWEGKERLHEEFGVEMTYEMGR